MSLRAEITRRVGLLHQQLNLAAVMLLAAAGFGYYLYLLGTTFEQLETFGLFLPLVFSCLTFNYQGNQMTLEALARYLREQSPGQATAAKWENFYGDFKRSVQLISFLKILPLLLPQLLPFIYLARHGWPIGLLDGILISFDLALLLLTIFNFRYKLR
mgnify:FL=1